MITDSPLLAAVIKGRITVSSIKGVKAFCQKGEDFLESFDKQIDYLYLDAFDFEHQGHSKERMLAYEKNLGMGITNDACHQMHLACAKAINNKMPSGSFIVFDDVWYDGGWKGKGETAVPYLLEIGFKVVGNTGGAIVLERIV